MKVSKLNIVMLVVAFVILFVFVFMMGGEADIREVLSQTQGVWLVGALLCMIVYWLLESFILHVIGRRIYHGLTFRQALNTSMVGQFFNCVTPSSTGGQPMQAYRLVQFGMPLTSAATALLSKFIVYQLTLVGYSIIVLIFKFSYFLQNVSHFVLLVIFGFALNLGVAAGLMCIAYRKGAALKIGGGCLTILGKLRLMKNVDEKRANLESNVERFNAESKFILNNKKLFASTAGLTVLQLTAYFIIPYFIYRGFMLTGADFFTMLSAQAFVLLISSLIPLPGAIGAAESSFVIMFGLFFPPSHLNLAMLVWRLLTFYLTILVGALFSVKLSKRDMSQPDVTTKIQREP